MARSTASWREVGFNEAFQRLKLKAFEIPTKDYQVAGTYPIIDQGDGAVAGYIDREDPISDVPFIVFGDHTTIVKYVDQPCFIGSQGVVPLKARECYDPYFLYLMLGRTRIPALGYSRHFRELENKTFPLPTLAEQRKIAEILRTWDEAIETAVAELKAKQELHQCLLQKAFSQGACIAAGEGKLLGEVVRLTKGKKPELYNEQFKGAVPYLVARFIRGEEPPQFASLSDKNAVSVAASDIVIICDGSNSGEMFTGLDGVLSSTMAKLIPTSSDFEKAYIRYFVGYNGLRLSEAQEGGAIPHLDREKLLNFRIPMLEKKEQQLVIERLNASERAVQFVNERAELLRAQKRGLMQKLLTGEVRVAA